MFLNSSFIMPTILAKTTVSTSKSIYQERFSNHQELGLYMKNDFNTVGKVAIYANLK